MLETHYFKIIDYTVLQTNENRSFGSTLFVKEYEKRLSDCTRKSFNVVKIMHMQRKANLPEVTCDWC